MKRIPIRAGTERSLPAFLAFLAECRAEAASGGTPRLVSVSLESDHLDPLAVLESIYEPESAPANPIVMFPHPMSYTIRR